MDILSSVTHIPVYTLTLTHIRAHGTCTLYILYIRFFLNGTFLSQLWSFAHALIYKLLLSYTESYHNLYGFLYQFANKRIFNVIPIRT